MKRYLSVALLACAASGAWTLPAAWTPAQAQTQASQPQAVTWYDGDRKVTLYWQPGLYAAPAATADSSGAAAANQATPLQRSAAGYVHVATRGTLALYQASAGVSGKAAQAATQNLLPVYSARPDWRDSPVRAQAPGVIVIFKASMPAQEISAWLASQGLQATPLAGGNNAYLIDGRGGLEDITLANRIYEAGVAVLAQPNWVISRSKR